MVLEESSDGDSHQNSLNMIARLQSTLRALNSNLPHLVQSIPDPSCMEDAEYEQHREKIHSQAEPCEKIHSQAEPSEKTSLLQYNLKDYEAQHQDSPLQIKSYKSRYWIAFITSLLCWLHTLQWGTWGPISESMNAAFPGWGPDTVALMVNWGTIMLVPLVIPLSWGIQRFGLRAGTVASAALMAIGTGIRCITKETPAFTILCHICAILVGAASALSLTTPVVIANDWFPRSERTTAIGVILGFSQLGSLGSYLEPLFVKLPSPGVSTADIQNDVMHLVYAGAIMSAVLFLALLVYFPSKPPSPPSLSSTTQRIEFLPGFASLMKDRRFLIMVASYGSFVGPPLCWSTFLNFSLLPLGFHQEKAMWVGALAVTVSSVSPVIVGRLNDLLCGHLKTLLITLMLATTAFFYWFLLLSYGILEVTDWQVYVSIIGACACNYAATPLFYEAAADMAFPVPDVLVTAVLTASDCITSTLFLSIYSIPDVGYLWITCVLTISSSFTIIPLLFLKFDYTRANIDATYNE